MPKKVKFKPEVTRIKLNPEQAVLTCACSTVGLVATAGGNDWRSDGTTNSLYCGITGSPYRPGPGGNLWYCNRTGGSANRQRLTGSASSS